MRRLIFLVVLCTIIALPLAAQNTDIESLSGLQFNFGNPGARSLGMGGAFLGLADDASAAEANPAGLTILRKTEFSIEARNYEESQLFSTTGTFPDVTRTAFQHFSPRVDVTFASVIVPIKNFRVGAYYHQPLQNAGVGFVAPQRNTFTGAVEADVPNFFLPRNGTGPVTQAQCEAIRQQANDPFACLEYTTIPFISSLDLQERTYGLAGAWQFGKLSLGATARYQQFREYAQTLRLSSQLETLSQVVQATGTVNSAGVVQVKAQHDVTFAAGFKFDATDKVSFGGVYKKGPKFTAPTFVATFATNFDYVPLADTTFHMPDVAGLGVSVRPIPVLTVNFDAVHVKYSNLVDDFVSINDTVRQLSKPFAAKDVTELHLGTEYFFSTKIPFALRAGFWRDPAHSTQYVGPLDQPDRVAAAMLFPRGQNQNHKSIGAGLAWPKFAIDAAYDSSPNYKVGSISVVARY